MQGSPRCCRHAAGLRITACPLPLLLLLRREGETAQEEVVGGKGDSGARGRLEDGGQRALEQPRRTLFGNNVEHDLPQATHRLRDHALQDAGVVVCVCVVRVEGNED